MKAVRYAASIAVPQRQAVRSMIAEFKQVLAVRMAKAMHCKACGRGG